ncbi:MAG: preprotein translocase subunit YajC [Bacteroidaceae bacterium]|nr:preprotein translocase subunit YajC [Bacteroidaceae bacterium]
MTTLSILLQAQPQGGLSQFSPIIMIVLLFVIMYFFMIRPQNKKQKELREFRNSLKVGQDVVTIGGLHGTVRSINEKDDTISLEVATGVKLTFDRTAIVPQGEKPQA